MDFASFPAFAGVDPLEIESLVSGGSVVELAPGQNLVTHGTAADRLFLVFEGTLRVHLEGKHNHYDLAEIAAPAVVGEVEMLIDGAHAASVTAVTDCKTLCVPYEMIKRRLAGGDVASLKFAYNVARLVAHRLQRMDERVIELLESDPEHPVVRQLAELGKSIDYSQVGGA